MTNVDEPTCGKGLAEHSALPAKLAELLAASVDEYVAQFPPETRKALEELRALIRATAPGVTERISYAIPTFDLNGKYLLYLAGYAKHVGLYPVTGAVAKALGNELKPYRSGKATLRFPLGKPMPTDLIRRIVELRVAEKR